MTKGRVALIVLLATALVGIVYLTTLKPSHDRNWYDFYDRTPDSSFEEDGTVVLRHVRNWKHDYSGTISKEWLEDVRVHPDEIKRVWFVISAIGDSKLVAHSFLNFELEDGRVISFSIEARREIGEPYSAILGLFRQYELAYTWGMERDFVGVRLFALKYRTEVYPLQLTKEEAGGVFKAMARATALVADNPSFYNTLTGNCTNLLAEAINASNPGRLPYDPSWNLPALSVGYLADQGFIKTGGEETIVVREKAVINRFTEELLAANGSPEDFSRALRYQYFESN